MNYDEEEEQESTLNKVLGYQIGDVLSICNVPLTALGVAIDYLDEHKDREAIETEVKSRREKDTIGSKTKSTTEINGGENEMTEYEDPAELVVAAEEGEINFEQYQAEVSTYEDLSDQEASYLAMMGGHLFLRDEVMALEDSSQRLLEVGSRTEEFTDDLIEQYGEMQNIYVEHLNEVVASMVVSMDYVKKSNENVEDAIESLQGVNSELEQAQEDSPVEDIRDLEASVNEALVPEETSEE